GEGLEGNAENPSNQGLGLGGLPERTASAVLQILGLAKPAAAEVATRPLLGEPGDEEGEL
ncbi:hypothetical protein, partial [Paludibacterium sp.]